MVAFKTTIFETVTPDPLTFTLAPAIKLEPVSIEFTVVPCKPPDGDREVREVREGPVVLTVNGKLLLVPEGVVTVKV